MTNTNFNELDFDLTLQFLQPNETKEASIWKRVAMIGHLSPILFESSASTEILRISPPGRPKSWKKPMEHYRKSVFAASRPAPKPKRRARVGPD